MRVLIADHKEIFGGGQVTLLNVLREWQMQNVAMETRVICSPRAELLSRARALGIVCETMELGAIEKTRGVWWNARQRIAPTMHLWRTMRAFRPDALLANGAYSFLACLFAVQLARVPVVWYEHNSTLPNDKILRRLILAAREIAVVSECIRAQFVQFEPRAQNKTTVVYNGIVPDEFVVDAAVARQVKTELGISESARVIGTVSRLSPEKNVGLFVQAAQMVLGKMPDAKFLIVGDGPERATLEKQARALSIADAMCFAGQRADVPRMLAAMDVFVLASDTEGFALALVEAMAAARAIVATDVGGAREALPDGECGVLIPPRDATALANAVTELLRHENKCRALGERARERVAQKFTRAQQAQMMQMILERAVRQ